MPRTIINSLALLFLLVLSDYAHGQNYQPLYSNSVQTFYQASSFPIGPFSFYEAGNMWGTRMDNIEVFSNGDTIYYNYPIYRDTAAENSNQDCIWWNAPNWNGKPTRIVSSGTSWFFNQNDDSIQIYHAAQLNEQWKAYSYPNGDSLMAQVVGVQWVDDDWVADSVKTIRFIRFSNGTPIGDILDSTKIEIYRNGGFRKMVDFLKFPDDTIQIHRVDLNSINRYSPGYSVNNEICAMPTIGDGFYRVARQEQLTGGQLTSVTDYPISQVILNVTPFGSNGQLLASVVSNNSSGSAVHDIVYHVLPDTIFTLVQREEGGNLMPREEGAIYMKLSE